MADLKRNMTCIVCPMGCTLEVELAEGNVTSVTGNSCPRGKDYAVSECTNPRRTVTTTVACQDGSFVPVKTSAPIPKGEMFNLVKELSKITISLPIKAGDVIIKDIYGADVVAAKSMG